ncbi:uncharacterized protein LOC133319984 [Danaus plexippus]|uniref:uncharacterized protein LOC133319984 n=1 Tax=Danaus plexippus TaxID=13037 RepID=UPI002AB176A4|nr:uncharacterized protein LOC133319984 [Danaus plexippus]
MFEPPGDTPPDDRGACRPPPPKRHYSGDEVSRNNTSEDSDKYYKPYYKQGYTRVFPESTSKGEYSVFVESTKDTKLGNQNPITLGSLFKNEVKGVKNIKRVNANKVSVLFEQTINANAFLKNSDFHTKNDFKVYIPARAVETIGVVRFVPTSISNEELFKKLSSSHEIIGVRRFMKRVNGERKPLGTISITFLTVTLPECVYLDIYRFTVSEYKAPLMQCYKCFKYNHSAKICKSTQKCSICSMEHHYSECPENSLIKCINCGEPHVAVSRDCIFKKKKIAERDARLSRMSYSQIINTPKLMNSTEFPSLPLTKHTKAPAPTPKPEITQSSTNKNNSRHEKPKVQEVKTKLTNLELIDQIIESDYVLKGLVGAVVSIGNDNPLLEEVDLSVGD